MVDELQRYERYVQADPRNTTLWIAYGDALHRSGQFDRAEKAFRNSIEISPENTVAWGRLAGVEISRGHLSEAEAILKRLLKEGEGDPALFFNLGLTLYGQRRFEAALEIFNALCSVPKHANEARYYLLSSLHNLDRADEAIERARAFLDEEPSPKLRGYLALVLMDSSDMTQACELARQTLSEQPDNPDAAAVLGTHAIESLEIEEAERHLRLVAAKEPKNVRGWQGLALTALHRQRHQEAIGFLQQAMARDPGNIGNYITLGWVHITQQDFKNAEQAFEAGIDKDRTDAELHGGLATALVFQRRSDAARREIELALRLDRRSFGAHFARSILLRLEGRQEKSTEIVAKLLEMRMRPDSASLMESLITHWKRQAPAKGEERA